MKMKTVLGLLNMIVIAMILLAGTNNVRSGSSSGSGGIAGVAGGVGNDQTLEYLYGMTNLPRGVDGPTYFFSSATPGGDFGVGSDSNTCMSADDPCLTWAKITEMCTFANCIIDAEDAAFLAVEVGDRWQVNFPVGGNDRISINLRSSKPGTRVTIDAENADGLITHMVTDGDVPGGTGVLLFQDIHFDNLSHNAWAIDNENLMIGLNVGCTMDPVTAVLPDCVQSPNGRVVLINSYCDNQYGNRSCFDVNENGKMTFISTKTVQAKPDGYTFKVQCDTPTADTCGLTVIGPQIRVTGDGTNASAIAQWDSTLANTMKIRVARTEWTGGYQAFAPPYIQWSGRDYTPPDTASYDIEIYQSTFRSGRSFLQTASSHGCSPTDRLIMKYNIFELSAADGRSLFTDQYNESGGSDGIGGCLGAEIVVENNTLNQDATEGVQYRMRFDAGDTPNDTTMTNLQSEIASRGLPYTTTLARFFQPADNTVYAGSQFGTPSVCTFTDIGGVTADSGDADTITSAGSFDATVDAHIGQTVTIRSGTNAGEQRQVVASTANSIDVSPAFTAAIDATSLFTLYESAHCTCGFSEDCFEAMGADTYDIELIAPIPGWVVGSTIDVSTLRLGTINNSHGSP